MSNFEFNIGDIVKDKITEFTGIITCRSQWLNGCNTYGVQPTELKDGVPQERQGFDEPQLTLLSKSTYNTKKK